MFRALKSGKIEFTVKNANTGVVIDISASEIDEITFRLFTSDNQTMLAEGTYTGGEITYVVDGTDGKCKWSPATGDMDTVGTHEGELIVDFTADSRAAYIQDMIIKIKPKAPTS